MFISAFEETSSDPAQGRARGSESLWYLPGVSSVTTVGKVIASTKTVAKIGVRADV